MLRKYKPLKIQDNIKCVCIMNLNNSENIKGVLLTANPFINFSTNPFAKEVDLLILDIDKEIPPYLKDVKEIMQISSYETFYTNAQIELNLSDWEVIKELEKLLPTNHELVIKRNKLSF